jgi:hypothetical protein
LIQENQKINIIVNNDVLFEFTSFPAVEKHRSKITDVAGIDKYFFVNIPIAVYLSSLDFH